MEDRGRDQRSSGENRALDGKQHSQEHLVEESHKLEGKDFQNDMKIKELGANTEQQKSPPEDPLPSAKPSDNSKASATATDSPASPIQD